MKKIICLFTLVFTFTSYGNDNGTTGTETCPGYFLDAVLNQKPETVNFLSEYHVDPNISLAACNFPIQRGSFWGLPVYYDNIDENSTLLHIAAMKYDEAIEANNRVKVGSEHQLYAARLIYMLLLNAGADIHATDSNGDTPSELVSMSISRNTSLSRRGEMDRYRE